MFRDALSGGCGAVCCVYVGLPFDVVKVRLQTQVNQGSTIYSGPFQCAKRIVSEEGFLSLWRGAMPALASASIENVALFATNGMLRSLVGGSQTEDLSVNQEFVLGGLAGVVSGTAITLPEMVKVRMQFQRKLSNISTTTSKLPYYQSGWECVTHTYKHEGLQGLFRGLAPTLARDVPYNMVQFGVYHNLAKALRAWQGIDNRAEQSLWQNFMIGGFAGTAAWAVVYVFTSL